MRVKQLIKNRSLGFLHPDVVEKATDDEINKILKSVAYFRNFSIFKNLYTILYKSNSLTIDHYRDLNDFLKDYRKNHKDDFFIEGFSKAIIKSIVVPKETKAVYALMIYNQLFDDDLFKKCLPVNCKRLQKAISKYYSDSRNINIAVIRKSKVKIINNGNLVKSICKLWNL